MASEDEKEGFFLPDQQTLDPTTAPLSLCFALGFYFILIQNANKHLALAIRLANGVIKATSAFHYLQSPSPSLSTLFFASKAIIKGFKVTKRLIPAGAAAGPAPSPISARKLKACVAAVNLLSMHEVYARTMSRATRGGLKDISLCKGFTSLFMDKSTASS